LAVRRKRREINIFNMSFLDVVSMAFGAVVLLLVIVKISNPAVIERQTAALSQNLERLRETNAELSQEIPEVEKQLQAKTAALNRTLETLDELEQRRQQLQARLAETQEETEKQQARLGELETARQELTAEMERLLSQQRQQVDSDSIIGGIPVDSEYIIFIIDTSGSMQEGAWPLVTQKIRHVLESYPEVEGLQVMSDMGSYMFSQYAGRWITDSPARRDAIISRMSSWTPFSNSSPVEGIQKAIQQFADPDKKISIFVFGDDFSAGSVEQVLRRVEQINQRRAGGSGERVRIHAMGFPVLFDVQGGISENTIRFAALMRALAQTNAGSFVGLNSRVIDN